MLWHADDDRTHLTDACDAGLLDACAIAIAHVPPSDPRFVAIRDRVRALCTSGDRVACSIAAFAEPFSDARRSFAGAIAMLDGACGRDRDLPRVPMEDGDDAIEDDPQTVEDERLEPAGAWYEELEARVPACSSLVRMAQVGRARIPAGSAARPVLRTACAEGDYGAFEPCTSLEIALSAGLGGVRDRAGATLVHDLAEGEQE
jgi:hypothetical protein